jgi:hypothetical protein
MLQRWFVHDSANTANWRLKGHAVQLFWDWVATWARCVSKPSDLGFSDAGYDLPPLNIYRHLVRADVTTEAGAERDGQGRLFRLPETSATSIHQEKRLTIAQRADVIAEKVSAEPDEAWIIWVDTDYEADAIKARIADAVEVRGSHSLLQKERALDGFATGQIKRLVTKAEIAGFGPNWQHCRRVAYPGLSFSYERYYQTIRRCWRFGQAQPVDVHIACADTELAQWETVQRKAGDHDAMKSEMRFAMQRAAGVTASATASYEPSTVATLPPFVRSAA